MGKIRLGIDEIIFDVINYILLSILCVLFMYPIVFVFSASVSKPLYLAMGEVFLFPKGFTLESFKAASKIPLMWRSYGNTIFITFLGTITNMFFTITGAYVLSKQELKGRTFLMLMIVFTMWFDPGIIPRYLNFRDLHLINKYSSSIVGFGISTFNLIILKTFFEGIPKSLEESARIDGANHLTIMTAIYAPLSGAALTTVSLFYAVSRWNGYFWSMILLTDDKKAPLQVLLRKLIVEKNNATEGFQVLDKFTAYTQETVIYAVIVISILPVLIVYPYVQKFFKKGVAIGAVKG